MKFADHQLDLRHYSDQRHLRPVVWQTHEHQRMSDSPFAKPTGLWVSVNGDDDWPSWCAAENFGHENLAFEHRIRLKQVNGVLHLSSAKEIDEFTDAFGTRSTPYHHQISYRTPSIDWRQVAKTYAGIIISPYCWERRMSDHTQWYYGWDCASGCIWHPMAIREVGEAAPTKFEESEV
jgi:hypothetical protein